jgi:hypothetical protein
MSIIKQVRSNQQRQMQQYVDQFGKIGHARGMLGESVFQNTIDAAFRGVIGKVKVEVFVDPEKRSMTIRDRGTTGMYHCDECLWSDIMEDGVLVAECENFKNCPWSAFHTMSMEGKGRGDLGQRGMGKSLLSLAGTGGIKVRTRTVSGDTMASWFRPKKDSGVGAWEWLLTPDERWTGSGDPGTEIEVVGLKDEFIKEFKNFNEMKTDYILPYWFFAISEGMEVKLMYRNGEPIRIGPGATKEMFPKEGQLLGKKIYKSVPIKMRGSTAGKISNLNIFLAKEPIAEELRGIALVKNGKQVIMRLQNFGRSIDPELQDCVFGWVNTGDLLDEFEEPNHLGYRPRPLLVRKTREKIETLTRTFLEPYQKERQKDDNSVSEKDTEKVGEIREFANKALDEVPEFNPWDDGKDPGDLDGEHEECKKCGQKPCVCPRPPPKERTKPWISSIKLEPKTESGYYDSGEEVKARVVISNPLDKKFPTMGLKWAATNLSHETVIGPFTIAKDEFGELPRGYGGIEGPGQIEKEFGFEISLGKPTDGGFRKGKNWLKVAIFIEDEGEVIPIDETKTGFYVEFKPEPKQSGSSGTNRFESFQMLPAGLGQGYDVTLSESEMTIYVYRDGPNIAPYWLKSTQKMQDATSNIIYGVADSIMELLLSTRLSPGMGDSLGAQEYDDLDFDEVYYELMGIKTRWIAAAQRIAGV